MYKRTPFLAIIIALLLFMVSCVDCYNIEPSGELGTENKTLVTLTIKDVQSKVIKTKVTDEQTINDVHVVIFNRSGVLLANEYSEGSTIRLKVPAGTGYSIYAIVNTSNPLLFVGSGVSFLANEDAFLKKMHTYGAGQSIEVNGRLLMSGALKNITIDGSTQSISNFNVERIVAKINLKVATAPGISITGYSIKNLHTLTYLIERPNPDSSDLNDLKECDDYDASLAESFTQNIELSQTNMSDVTFYMYPNRAGGRKWIDGDQGTLTNEQEKAMYAPSRATYIEIRTKGTTYSEAKHRIYLGADNCMNYSIKRNGVYTYTIYIKDKMVADTRVQRLEEPSNCYLVQPNGRVTFPVSRANEDGVTRLKTSTYSAELLWVDNDKKMSADGTIKSVSADTTNGTITVDTGAAQGNAVVVLKDGADIIWSWHIWVSDYVPSDTQITYNNGKRTTVFMDRNLGAKNATVDDVGSMGLLYQWGRKDPFPGATAFKGNVAVSIYNKSGVLLNEGKIGGVEYAAVAVSNNLENSIKKPLTVYYNGASPNDWYSNTTEKKDNLWNGASTLKSVYDPCPVGWRVPTSGDGTLSPWFKSDFRYKGTYSNGWNWNDSSYNLGWYPSIPIRTNYSGKLFATITVYWSAAVSANQASGLGYSDTVLVTSFPYNRATATAVRCVRI